MRAEFEWQNTGLLSREVRVQVSSPAPRFARLAQTGHERWSYKPEVPESQAGLGTRNWAMELLGVVASLAMRIAGGFDAHMVHQIGGHNSMAEYLVANEDVAGSIPADRSMRCWYIGRASAFQAEEAGSTPARRSKSSGCRVTGSPPVLGTGQWRFKSSHPDQIVAGLRSGPSVVS